MERHLPGPERHSNEKNPSPTIIAIPAVKMRGDHIPQGLAATCADEMGDDETLDPGVNVTLKMFFPGEDGESADVKLEKWFAAVVACITVCCTGLDRPPLVAAGALPEILFSILVACGTLVSGPLDSVTEDPVIADLSVVASAELSALLAAADAVSGYVDSGSRCKFPVWPLGSVYTPVSRLPVVPSSR